jgi:hypothetical protein
MGKRSKKLKMKKNNRRGTIQDINHNHTNITIDFWKLIPLKITGGALAMKLDPSIAALTADLGEIYKLYRFTSVKFIFQASEMSIGEEAMAINYIPAAEAAPTPIVSNFGDFEGPSVGYYESTRGSPYHYTVPSKVLNAMPYNWYETRPNNPNPSDLTQGMFVFLSSITSQDYIRNCYAHFVIEFQTLEDPAFLTHRMRAQKSCLQRLPFSRRVECPRPSINTKANKLNAGRKDTATCDDQDDYVSIYGERL